MCLWPAAGERGSTMVYQSKWLLALAAALAVHGLFGAGMAGFPLMDKTVPPPPSPAVEIDMDGEEGQEPGEEEGSEEPEAALLAEEVPPAVPDIKEEPPLKEEDAPVEEEKDDKPIEAESLDEAVKVWQKEMKQAARDGRGRVSDTLVVKKGNGGRQMGEPPVVITDSYPPDGMYTFKGVVRVFTTIGEDGRVKATKVAVTSGNRAVDELAMAFCRRWTFKPAKDSKGEPMACTKLIRIPFNVSPAYARDQKERNR